MSQYHFVPQTLHKACSSTTLYYKAWTNEIPVQLCNTNVPVLFCTTKAYTSLYHKASTKNTPVVLCTTKLAQSTSLCDFVPQRLQKAVWHSRHNTSPVLPCTTNLAQQTPQEYFEPKSFHQHFSILPMYHKRPYPVYNKTPHYDFLLQTLFTAISRTCLYKKG